MYDKQLRQLLGNVPGVELHFTYLELLCPLDKTVLLCMQRSDMLKKKKLNVRKKRVDNEVEKLKKSKDRQKKLFCGLDIVSKIISMLPMPVSTLSGTVELLNEAIQGIIRNSYQEKLKLVLEEIATGHRFVTKQELSEVDVIENLNRLMQAISRTNVNDKIRIMTRLFVRGCISEEPLNTDTYEEYLHILEDLSVREIAVLAILYSVEQNPDAYIDKEMSKEEYLPHRYWEKFKEKVTSELGIPASHIYAIMKRLERSGLFAMYNGFSFGTVEEGTTTAYFDEFYKYIKSFEET